MLFFPNARFWCMLYSSEENNFINSEIVDEMKFTSFSHLWVIYYTILHSTSGTYFQLKLSLLRWLITHTNYCCSSGCTLFERIGTASKCIITYYDIYYDY